jgi:hypothetical protein
MANLPLTALTDHVFDNLMMNTPHDLYSQAQTQAHLAQQAQAIPSRQWQEPMPPTLAQRARELFLKRMGGIRAEMKVNKDDFVQCHIYGEVVHLFFCFGGKTGVVQEQIDIFPSDQLITQFRMILA